MEHRTKQYLQTKKKGQPTQSNSDSLTSEIQFPTRVEGTAERNKVKGPLDEQASDASGGAFDQTEALPG